MAYPWNAGDVVTASDLNAAIAAGGGGGASVTVSDTPPSSPSEGDLWFESDTGDILVYYDSAWVDVGGISVANIAVQSTAPTSPVNGDFWFDTDTAQTFVWYDDGTSTQWVEVGAASAAASGTDGAVQFASGGALSSDASNLVWDDTNNRLGIGTTSPSTPLHIVNSVPTIQLTDSTTNADSIITADSSNGSLSIGADENNEVPSSQIAFKVDGTTVGGFQANGNLEMLGGTVKGDGALVQMVSATSGVSDLTSAANIASITMSPKYSDSTMLVAVNFHAYKYNTGTNVNNQYRLYESGGGDIRPLSNYVVYSPNGDSYMFQGVVSGTIAAGSTASRTYHYYVTASSSADRIYFYWKTIYVLEIAT